MTITTDEAIQMAREYGYGGQQITPEELTAFANAVRRKTLLEAADWFEREFEGEDLFVVENLRRMAEED